MKEIKHMKRCKTQYSLVLTNNANAIHTAKIPKTVVAAFKEIVHEQ